MAKSIVFLIVNKKYKLRILMLIESRGLRAPHIINKYSFNGFLPILLRNLLEIDIVLVAKV